MIAGTRWYVVRQTHRTTTQDWHAGAVSLFLTCLSSEAEPADYLDGEVLGVYDTRDEAEARLAEWQPTQTFEEWMRAVDAELMRLAGVTSDGIYDYLYRDFYDDGRTPADAATSALKHHADARGGGR